MNATRLLLGFDIRHPPENYMPSMWTPDRREMFLLREDVQWPMSVDSLVWPSVFRYHESMARGTAYEIFDSLETVTVLREYAVDHLWRDRQQMRSRYESSGLATSGQVEIAVSVIRLGLSQYDHWEDAILPSPADRTANESFLGYDVADEALISGLSNCGYERSEKETLRGEWSSRLNQHGLLSTIEDAAELREITDRRVPEHAPFWIFELSRTKE